MKKRKVFLPLASVLALLSMATVAAAQAEDVTDSYKNLNASQYQFKDYEYSNKSLGKLCVYAPYQGNRGGISYIDETPFHNDIEDVTYQKWDLLPTWKCISDKLNVEITDGCNYAFSDTKRAFASMQQDQFKSSNGENIDLFATSISNINQMAMMGDAVNLNNYLDKMPNFKAFLEANPAVRSQIDINGGIYFTPYFDGYNSTEKTFIMDTEIAEKIIDATDFSGFDTKMNGNNAATNTLQAPKYTPFIDEKYNLPKTTNEINVAKDNKVLKIKLPQVDNIINKQNELLSAGCTGKELAIQFKEYLVSVYGDYVGADNVYSKYSEVFTSSAAAYNTDELIALLRVIKANPGVISGNPEEEIQPIIPRGQQANRVENIADFMAIFGIQGMDSEKDMLYFGADGKIHDGATTLQTYEALDYLAAMYDEGLILEDFYGYGDGRNQNLYFHKYFSKQTADYGYGFMEYDFNTSQSVANDAVNGIGTTDRIDPNVSVKGIMPVLPPLTYWATDAAFDPLNQHLLDKTGKSLIRYQEGNRGLKTDAWCILSHTTNLDGALALMDYLYSEDGRRIMDYGPDEAYCKKMGYQDSYWTLSKKGVITPVVTDKWYEVYNSYNQTLSKACDVYTFARYALGSDLSVGYCRSNSFDRLTVNQYALKGYDNVRMSVELGVVVNAMYDKSSVPSWDTSVPIATTSIPVGDIISSGYTALASFWNSDKLTMYGNPDGWVSIVVGGYKQISGDGTALVGRDTYGDGSKYTYNDVISSIPKKNSVYLNTLLKEKYEDYIPEYAKGTN